MDEISSSSLSFTYKNERPVELADLTSSLEAVAKRYSRFAVQSGIAFADEKSSALYVREIRPGSIIVDLINSFSPSDIAAIGDANSLVTFAKTLGNTFDWLKEGGKKPYDVPTSELKDIAQIMGPAAKDAGGQISISAKDQANIAVSIHYNSLDANAIQDTAGRIITERAKPTQNTFKKVLMYLWQATKETSSTKDKAVIEDISDKPLKVIFEDDDIKDQIINGTENPFKVSFIVDVHLQTVHGKPKVYKVTKLYDIIDDT